MTTKEAIDAGARVLLDSIDGTAEDARIIADLVLDAAIPHLTRIVTTIEELDELPIGSIVVDDCNTDWRKTSEGIEGDNWDSSSTHWTHAVDDIALPAKLVHLGASK
jgi:hypothetical protein